jgi:cholesterol oxidase
VSEVVTRPSVAVIGSGFGGAVMACRLAESQRFDVTVLERGPRYARGSFPRRPEQMGELFWDPDDAHWGLFEYRSFPRSAHWWNRGPRSGIDVLTAAGLGGGSLIYSSVLYRMPERFFAGWPAGLGAASLDRWYAKVEAMLELKRYPMGETWRYRTAPKARALAEAAAKLRADPRGGPAVTLDWPNLAVQFGERHGLAVVNQQGQHQGTCTMCGECNLGCNEGAKNSLDITYLARAERFGATIRTWSAVTAIRRNPEGPGWRLAVADPRGGRERHHDFDRVIVAAGSLGSTQLLLEMKGALGLDSPAMGSRWSPNGDLLGFITHAAFAQQPTIGPVITGALHVDAGSYPDGFPAGAWIEDGGLPSFLIWYLLGKQTGWRPTLAVLGRLFRVAAGWFGARGGEANIGNSLARIILTDPQFLTRTMMLLGMGRDRSTGTLTLQPGSRYRWDRLRLAWQSGDGELHYERLRTTMARIAEALGGRYVENPLSFLNRYISVHPLGGLPMAERIEDGPVEAASGRVFGCDGLYVVDGSIIPTAVGPNPSLTIAALAELYAARMVEESSV